MSINSLPMSQTWEPSNKSFQGNFREFQISHETCCFFFGCRRVKHTGKATKGKVQDIGEVNKVMPLPLPSSDRVRG